MTRESVPPNLAELLARYLQRQASAHQEGLGYAEPPGEVVPFEAVPAQPVDPRLAWDGAVAAARCFQPGVEARSCQAPPEWPALVVAHEPEIALAFCAGNFPQLVRHLLPLLQAPKLADLYPSPGRMAPAPALLEWADELARKPQYPQVLLAAGALRLARQFDRALDLLTRQEKQVPVEWQRAWANELAALAWHRGRADEAVALWQAQPESAPVHFNRGMAALFLGGPADARAALGKAVQQLPESGAWHHLGRLYLALAEMRG